MHEQSKQRKSWRVRAFQSIKDLWIRYKARAAVLRCKWRCRRGRTATYTHRVEKLSLYDAMAQAKADKKASEKPAVMHRKNRCKWLVTMELDDWIELYREWECGHGKLN